MSRPQLQVRVRGKRIPVRQARLPIALWGLTHLEGDKEILVSRRLKTSRSRLITVLHEALHHLRPKAREEHILKLEQDLVHLMQHNKTLFRRLLAEL